MNIKKMLKDPRVFEILIYVFLIGILIIILLLKISDPNSKFVPFAIVPETKISQTLIPATNQRIIHALLHIPFPEVDQDMLKGDYQRYPLNKPMQPTSVTAVDVSTENQELIAWNVEIDVERFNILWPDVYNAYWTTLINVIANPIVVIKGTFPSARYFSFYSYGGLEITDDGKLTLGQGISKHGENICNPTIPGDCQGLADRQIEPDVGSKNPFNDSSYKSTDECYYTIYFISPYYKGPLPRSKNILPLTVFGLSNAAILYRVYAPFNPKSCESRYYTSNLPLSTLGCDNKKIQIPRSQGSAAYPYLDETSPCKANDKECVKACVNHKISKTLPKSCIAMLTGNNKYCICSEKNYNGPCGEYLNNIIRDCSNQSAGLANYCKNAYKSKVPQCVDDIPGSENITSLITSCKQHPEIEKELCQYINETKRQICTEEKLYSSDNPDCKNFLNPQNLPDICKQDVNDPNTCRSSFRTYLNQCILGKDSSKVDLTKEFCNNLPPPECKVEYDFDIEPLDCTVENYESCENRFVQSECDPTNVNRYMNIQSYTTNTQDSYVIAMSGWVGLPEVFLKYSYNNYFVRMRNDPIIKSKLNIFELLQTESIYSKSKNRINANDPFLINESFQLDAPATTQECDCNIALNKDTYFNDGTVFLKGMTFSPKLSTIRIDPPGCNFYSDLCECQQHGKKNKGPCNETIKGFLDSDGSPCFHNWTLPDVSFSGIAKPFILSSNTGSTIIFPNPDNAYIGCPTQYDPKQIYVVWCDIPTTPKTPGFKEIVNNTNQLRYWSLGHYYYEMDILNPRPVVSGIMDQHVKYTPITYKDSVSLKKVSGNRAVFVICTYTQYQQLKNLNLWNDKLNWLNWGKTKHPSLQDIKKSVNTIVVRQKLDPSVQVSLQTMLLESANDDEQFLDVLNNYLDQVVNSFNLDNDDNDTIQKIKDLISSGTLRIPKYGILLLRQLSPLSSFKESIDSYVRNNPKCLTNSIEVKQPHMKESIYINPSCNTGNKDISTQYGLEPCCLSNDVLNHMKQYYPRCEKIQMCDIDNCFWDKYLDSALPYQ